MYKAFQSKAQICLCKQSSKERAFKFCTVLLNAAGFGLRLVFRVPPSPPPPFCSSSDAAVLVEEMSVRVVSGFSKLFSLEVLDVSDNKIAKVRILMISPHAFFLAFILPQQ